MVTAHQAPVAEAKPCHVTCVLPPDLRLALVRAAVLGQNIITPYLATTSKPHCCVQGQKHLSTSFIHLPSEDVKLASSSFQQGHLTVMWSNGLLQSYNTALIRGTTLSVQTSRRLHTFDLGSDQMVLDDQDQQHQQEPAQQHTGNKKRKSTAAAAAAKEPAPADDLLSATPVPLLVPLGGHLVAAIREPSDLPINGHHSSHLDITVVDTQYGCVQSVSTVKLPGSGAVDQSGKDQQEALQLSSGMGDLVLLMHGAVWYVSIQVRHSRSTYSPHQLVGEGYLRQHAGVSPGLCVRVHHCLQHVSYSYLFVFPVLGQIGR